LERSAAKFQKKAETDRSYFRYHSGIKTNPTGTGSGGS
jgi:hypothetical protein